MTTHWGEFETPEVENEEVIPAEIVKLFIMKAMQQDPFRTPLPLATNSTEPQSEMDLMATETTGLEMDDRVLHTIKLLQHAREMGQLIEAAKEQTELMADTQINTFPPALDIPDHPISSNNYKMNYPLQYMDKEFSGFSMGKGLPPPEISTKTAKELLKKSVAAMLAHSGFDLTTGCILNTLTDVTEEYIKKMTGLLRVAVDQGANSMVTGFPDAMERVFHEMSIGSVRNIHEYYQNKVIRYHEMVMEECKALNLEYSNMSIPIKESLNLDNITKLEETVDVPEIHFPALCEGEAVDELQASLKPGFQMLHSLEQEVHLHTLDSQEEEVVNSSDSPVADSAFTGEVQSDFAPVAKKRKRI